MEKLQAIIDIYNTGQNEWKAEESMLRNNGIIIKTGKKAFNSIDFYEWIFNEDRYHVMETFYKKNVLRAIWTAPELILKDKIRLYSRECFMKQPKKIIEYLLKASRENEK